MSEPRKLRLNLQDLSVESFDATASEIDSRGTVFGRETQVSACYTYYYGCPFTAGGTCYQSCPNTCYVTCPGVGECPPAAETEEATCFTCYWVGGQPYYDGNC